MTEVPVVEEWRRCDLGDALTLQRGFDLPHRLRREGIVPIVSSSGISGRHNRAMITAPGIVTGRYGTIGEVFYIEENFWPLNTTLYVRDFKGNDPRYLSYLLRTVDFTSHSGKSGVPGINRNDIHKLPIALPPLREQRAIAHALSEIDGLLSGLDRLIAKKRDIKQATMQQLLTARTRLPGFKGEWEVKSLFDLAERKKELFDDGDWIEAEFLTESGIRLVQTGNIGTGVFIDKEDRKYISAGSFKKLRCKELHVGDILICRLAEPAGRACILPDIGEERLITAVDVTIFRPPTLTVDRRFIVFMLSTPQWLQAVSHRSGGSTRSRIARGELGRMAIKLPSLREQTTIAELLMDIDAGLSALESRREKTRALKQAMMQELLTGKTRLV